MTIYIGSKVIAVSKEQFEEIVKQYEITLFDSVDVCNALWFVYDILIAEADATKEAEPYATVTIERLEKAAYEVSMIANNVRLLAEATIDKKEKE